MGANASNPTGTIISFLGNPGNNNESVPIGYLACDGKVYNISDYTNLANQIEATLGSKNYYGGDGEATFAVPNLQGEFLRGYSTDSTASVTSGVTTADIGKHQDSTLIAQMYLGDTGHFCLGKLVSNQDKSISSSNSTWRSRRKKFRF